MLQRPIIQKLPIHIANQIAAGEVVERPAAVIKELIENSLDAKSTRIEVTFENGGKTYMCVNDNGHGMTKEEARLSLERHATSKLRSAEDLLSLATFGFRGEALPSIASISEFILSTKITEALDGWEIIINSGQLIKERPCAKTTGTRIEIRHLFHPVPARRKFLKTDATEAAHIIELVKLYALAYPEIGFLLKENNRILFNATPCKHLKERFESIYSHHTTHDFVEHPRITDHKITLHGLISRPKLTRTSREDIITFVNNRPITSRLLTQAILDAYRTFLPPGRYPMVFLFIHIDPAAIDVNVHPTKQEVRFKDEVMVRQMVFDTVKETLENSFATTQPATPIIAHANTAFPFPAIQTPTLKASPITPITPFEIREPRTKIQFQDPLIPPYEKPIESLSAQPTLNTTLKITKPNIAEPSLFNWTFLSHLTFPYSLLQAPDGLIIFHQKRAYQHIAYHNILHNHTQSTQKLITPIPLALNSKQDARLSEVKMFLNEQGFEFQPHPTTRTHALTAIPSWLMIEQAAHFIESLLTGWADHSKSLTHQDNSIIHHHAQHYSQLYAQSQSKANPETILKLAKALMTLSPANRLASGELIYTLLQPSIWQKDFQSPNSVTSYD